MSLLRRGDSLPNVPDNEDDEPQTAGKYPLDDDSFPDDVDDDNLSFDGIYDDDEEPPVYHQEPTAPDVPENLPSSLPRLFSGLTLVAATPTITKSAPRQQDYYPGIDVCIVREVVCPAVQCIELGK